MQAETEYEGFLTTTETAKDFKNRVDRILIPYNTKKAQVGVEGFQGEERVQGDGELQQQKVDDELSDLNGMEKAKELTRMLIVTVSEMDRAAFHKSDMLSENELAVLAVITTAKVSADAVGARSKGLRSSKSVHLADRIGVTLQDATREHHSSRAKPVGMRSVSHTRSRQIV